MGEGNKNTMVMGEVLLQFMNFRMSYLMAGLKLFKNHTINGESRWSLLTGGGVMVCHMSIKPTTIICTHTTHTHTHTHVTKFCPEICNVDWSIKPSCRRLCCSWP